MILGLKVNISTRKHYQRLLQMTAHSFEQCCVEAYHERMSINGKNARLSFPAFDRDPNMTYLDSAATSQMVRTAIDTLRKHEELRANAHRGMYALAERATEAYENARETVRAFLNACHAHEIIFVKNASEAINVVAGGMELCADDCVATTVLEHHSNIVPWQMTKADVSWIDIDDEGNLIDESIDAVLDRKPVLVAVTARSNVLGTCPNLKAIIDASHQAGALVLVDAAQHVAHAPVNVQELNCDFLVFSGHKAYGPRGVGVLYGKRESLERLKPVLGGGMMIHEVTQRGFSTADIPQKFEAGTQNVAAAAGLAAALQWIDTFDWKDIMQHEASLIKRAHAKLSECKRVTILGPKNANDLHGCISFAIEDMHAHDVTHVLGGQGYCLRAGHHCAQPLHDRLGVTASVRLSVGIYNTAEEVEDCCNAIANIKPL